MKGERQEHLPPSRLHNPQYVLLKTENMHQDPDLQQTICKVIDNRADWLMAGYGFFEWHLHFLLVFVQG